MPGRNKPCVSPVSLDGYRAADAFWRWNDPRPGLNTESSAATEGDRARAPSWPNAVAGASRMRNVNWIRLSTILLVLDLQVPGMLADIAVGRTASDRLPPPSFVLASRGCPTRCRRSTGSGSGRWDRRFATRCLTDSLRARLDRTSGRTLVVGASGEYESIQDAARAARRWRRHGVASRRVPRPA